MKPSKEFVYSMGRMKYLTPIYQALVNTKQKPLAVDWLQDNLKFYHPSAVDKLKSILGMQG